VDSSSQIQAPTSFSLDKVLEIAKHDVFMNNFLRRTMVTTYDEFLNVLYDDIKLVIERLEENPQDFPDETEDATTKRIADILWGMQYSASHNLAAGGNVDLTVAITRLNFKWIAEAKKFGSVSDMREGYLQLSTRYKPSMGSNGVMYGGMIGYLRRPDAATHMKSWREALPLVPGAEKSVLADCARRYALAFQSEHTHKDFGVPLRIWHNCVVLTFQPQDKSGRVAKRYQKGAGEIDAC
jgi:hypothetical protein